MNHATPLLSLAAAVPAERIRLRRTLARRGVAERDLDDRVQDTLLTALAGLERLDPARPIGPWLNGIAARIGLRDRCLARHRREVLGDAPDRADDEESVEARLDRARAQAELRRALAGLDEPQAEVLTRHAIDGEPIPAVAVALDIPLNTAWSRLRRGRAALVVALGAATPGRLGRAA